MDELNNQPDDQQNQKDEENNPEQPGVPSSDHDNKHEIKPLISPIAAAFIGLIGGFVLYQVLGGLLTLIVFGFDFEHAPVNGVRLMTIAGQLLFILLPALIFSKMFYEDIGTIIRAKIPKIQEVLLFTLGIAVLTFLLQNYLYIQNFYVEKLAASSQLIKEIKTFFDSLNDLVEKTYGNLLSAANIFEAVFVIAVVAIVPALCEEVMFRGFIQKSFEFKIKPFWAALITAVFFGLYHFNPYGTIPLIALGFYFGFAAYKSNSILVPMILHFFNNFVAILTYFAIGNEDLINPETTGDVDMRYALLTFVILLIIFSSVILIIKRYYSNQAMRQTN